MGASLVGRSHCETPVLIWTSACKSVGAPWCHASCRHAECRDGGPHTVVFARSVDVLAVSRGMQCNGGAAE
jgi:hypothetical protein